MSEKVRIAQDALTQLEAGRLDGIGGMYVAPNKAPIGSRGVMTRRQLLDGGCAVCAKGALVIGMLRPDEPLGDIYARLKVLATVYGAEQADLIEACFEGGGSKNSTNLSERYAEQYGTDRQNLRAILANIVRNDGIFKPEQDLEGAS